MKYIVFWVLYNVYSIPCPQPKPVPDEFGRMPTYGVINSAACTTKERVGLKQKIFYDIDSAKNFYDRAKAIQDVGFGGELDSVRLVSLKIR